MTARKPRKKAKIALNTKHVFILASGIVILSLLFLLVSALFAAPGEGTASETYIYIEENARLAGKAAVPPAAGRDGEAAGGNPLAGADGQTPPPAAEPSRAPAARTDGSAGAAPPAPASEPVIPPAEGRAVLVFIIDDAGQSVENLRRYTALPLPLAIAMLPGVAHTAECSALVRSSGKELMLHQPMQAENLAINPGPKAILPAMSTEQAKALVRENLASLGGGVKGMNNHEGSLITENVVLIGAVLDVVREQGIYFVDSRTTVHTQAPAAAASRNMRILSRDIFLDNVIERGEMLAQLAHGLSLANKNGKVIMIGHVDKSADVLPDLLAEVYPQLLNAGYTLAVPSQLP